MSDRESVGFGTCTAGGFAGPVEVYFGGIGEIKAT